MERRIDSLEKSIERDRTRAEEEKDKAREKRWRRQEWWMAILWTIYVATIASSIVLAATGQLHH